MQSIVLIGMPGSGKTTVGKCLAHILGWRFVDTDLEIVAMAGKSLQDIVMQHGVAGLMKVESEALASIALTEPTVVASGGSAIFAKTAISQLRERALIVYLEASVPTLQQRVGNWDRRGIVKNSSQTLEEVFVEREPLYRQLAHVSVDADNGTMEDVAERVKRCVQARWRV